MTRAKRPGVRSRISSGGERRRIRLLSELSWSFWVPFGVLAALLVAAYFVPLPYDPSTPNPSNLLSPPSALHPFGTDRSGFDVLSRTVSAARIDLPLAISGSLLALVIGVPIGLVAGRESRLSALVMRGVDMFQAFPLLVLAITLVALMGNQLSNIVVAIVLVNVPRFIRLVHAESLTLRRSTFIEAVEAFGAPPRRVLFLHILPNMSATVFAQASLATAHSVVVVAALSFLGIGVNPPLASWGAMIRAGAPFMVTGEWWVAVFPGLAVLAVVASFNALADRLMAVEQERRA